MSRSWLIVSGKGGVGKTFVTAALGAALAQGGSSCCVLDADFGLRGLEMWFGLQSSVVLDAMDVAGTGCRVEDALLNPVDLPGLHLLAAPQYADADARAQDTAERIIGRLKQVSPYVLLDGPAGLDENCQHWMRAADRVIVVTTPDDTALRDCERTCELVRDLGKETPLLVVNRVHTDWLRRGVGTAPKTIAAQLDMPLLGFIPEDDRVQRAQLLRETVTELEGPAVEACGRIAGRFAGKKVPMPKLRRMPDWLLKF